MKWLAFFFYQMCGFWEITGLTLGGNYWIRRNSFPYMNWDNIYIWLLCWLYTRIITNGIEMVWCFSTVAG